MNNNDGNRRFQNNKNKFGNKFKEPMKRGDKVDSL